MGIIYALCKTGKWSNLWNCRIIVGPSGTNEFEEVQQILESWREGGQIQFISYTRWRHAHQRSFYHQFQVLTLSRLDLCNELCIKILIIFVVSSFLSLIYFIFGLILTMIWLWAASCSWEFCCLLPPPPLLFLVSCPHWEMDCRRNKASCQHSPRVAEEILQFR